MNLLHHLKRLEKSKEFWFLLATCFLFFLLRLPSLFEPYWYGDEGIYEVIGFAMRHGRMLYTGIWDNKPPLLYITYALFNGSQPEVRTLALLFGLGSVISMFFLAKKLFGKSKSTYLATILFALLFAIPLLEGNIANAENFMLLPILIAAILFVSAKPKNYKQQYVAAGLLLATALLYKIVAVFDIAAFVLFLLIRDYKKPQFLLAQIKPIVPFIIGILMPILFTFGYFFLSHAFSPFIKAVLTQNVGYVGYGNKLLIPQGFLILKVVILVVISAIIFRFRKRISVTELFIYLWMLFSLFNMFFSQRPYTHYVLVGIPSISLLAGLTLWKKAKLRSNFLFLIIMLLLIVTNFHFYAKTVSYYGNFLAFIINNKSVTNYEAFFDSRTPGDYDIAAYLLATTKKSDSVFLWSNSAQIYRLIEKLPPGRFTVAYHITNTKQTMQETAQVLKKAKPQFIVVQNNDYPFTLAGYHEKIMLGKTAVYERSY